MSDLPVTQTAIVGLPGGDLGVSKNVGVPDLEEDMIMVKNVAIALNPVDTKMTGNLACAGAISGMDFAGEVVAMGSKVTTPVPIKLGDRVCGAVQGMHSLTPKVGAFAEYVGATGFVTMRIPDAFSFEQGASLGSGLGTIGLALFRSLQVPGYPTKPAAEPKNVLVYGGSTATGTMAIQLLKLSGLTPITTCSPRNFELVKAYGAEKAFDYNSPTCIADIKAYTKNSLKFVLDCISEPETMKFCYACIGRSGGKYTALEPYAEFLHTRPTVKPDWVLGPTLLGKEIGWGPPFKQPGNPEVRDFAIMWFKTAQELLDAGKIKLHPLKSMPGGFQGVLDGMSLLRNKQISGEKLVYRVP
ncbi:putative zinc-binding dehydrogenase family oxidoreductase [Rhexocercosporidium sp. MPI-PUGE-AT-0058]|nr:putative zinc-binding dehydrogenase family oxidoreductase [Rhexocercosporidium sp. MPI-PUGE-AT-0058]